ncbi:hypothetical protein JVU11DRAFT_4703 [Chiua virens]|nr:hypothetical protein JVU11DRAFT_4703 [Chiua virens]
MIFNSKYFVSFLTLIALGIPAAARLSITEPNEHAVWPRGSSQSVIWDADDVDFTALFNAIIMNTNPASGVEPVWIARDEGWDFQFDISVPQFLIPGNYQIVFVEFEGNDNSYRSKIFKIV